MPVSLPGKQLGDVEVGRNEGISNMGRWSFSKTFPIQLSRDGRYKLLQAVLGKFLLLNFPGGKAAFPFSARKEIWGEVTNTVWSSRSFNGLSALPSRQCKQKKHLSSSRSLKSLGFLYIHPSREIQTEQRDSSEELENTR